MPKTKMVLTKVMALLHVLPEVGTEWKLSKSSRIDSYNSQEWSMDNQSL